MKNLKETIKEKINSYKEVDPIKKEKLLAKKWLQDLHKTNKVFYDNLVGSNKSKFKQYINKRIGTGHLYEKIGNSEVWDGAYPILANDDDELGSYIVLQIAINKFIFLDNITPDDWTPTRNNDVKKLLEIVKFANDDYRVRAKIKGETFYFKRPIYKKKIIKEKIQTEEGTEIIETEDYCYDDEGNVIIESYEEVPWKEPKAVTQSGREAIRIGNAYKIRMRNKRAAKETIWSKYGMQIMMVFMCVMICGTWYLTAKMQTSAMSSEWNEIREERSKGIIDPESFAEKVVEKQKQIETNEKAPPK